MKRQKNRQKVDTLYILGAGASKALSDVKTRSSDNHRRTTPIDSNFLALLSTHTPKTGWQKRALRFIKDNWLDSSDILSHRLEEAVIKRVAHFDMLSALYPDKSRRKCSNEMYLKNLSHLVADYLSRCRSNGCGDTRKFVNHVFPPLQPYSSYTNRIITFNYDLLIDRPLLERGIPRRALYFDRLVSKHSDGIKRSVDQRFLHPLLLKLHGSLNWSCHRDYFNQIIGGTVDLQERIPIWMNDSKCPAPSDDESPLIIPPVPNKPITKASIFRMLWTTALEYMHETKRIVIAGYSCPVTYVLAQSMFTQFRNMKLEEVIVVDPMSSALPKFHELMSGRIKKTTSWKYFPGFHEFLETI